MNLKPIVTTVILSSLYACGGGSSSSFSPAPDAAPEDATAETGVFLDSPVENIGYRTETLEGVTNAQGEYDYIEGETVTFFIGDLEFPSVEARGVVTPLDIADSEDPNASDVVNMVRLLQTLDEDGDPDNGISITEGAKSAATQLDFSLAVEDFASDTAVTELVSNAGQQTSVTDLVSVSDALNHFNTQLQENDISFTKASIVGAWANTTTENDLLAFIFFDNGTYIHTEVDFSDTDEDSGMEWGTYSLNVDTGEITTTQTFDENGDTGLTDNAQGLSNTFTETSGDTLTLSFDDDLDGTTEFSLDFQRVNSDDIVGGWLNTTTENDFLAFIFFDNGTYIHAEVDFSDTDEDSGMEWGTYSLNESTGEITTTQTFDENGDTGLTDNAQGQSNIFAETSGDTLTLSFDDDLDGTPEGSLEFQRQ